MQQRIEENDRLNTIWKTIRKKFFTDNDPRYNMRPDQNCFGEPIWIKARERFTDLVYIQEYYICAKCENKIHTDYYPLCDDISKRCSKCIESSDKEKIFVCELCNSKYICHPMLCKNNNMNKCKNCNYYV